jgi:hypothetical protein
LGGCRSENSRIFIFERWAAAREYQVSRYDPQLGATLSQVNRLAATLEEVATKTRVIICGDKNSSAAPSKIPGSSALGDDCEAA